MNNLLEKSFQRRSFLLGGAKGSLLLGLVGRLYTLQIVQNDHFQNLSDKNRIHNFLILPDRGLITDRNNIVLAESKNEYFSMLDRDQIKIKDIDHVIEKLKDYIELNDTDVQFIYKQFLRRRSIEPIVIKGNLSLKEMYRLEVHLADIQGLRCETIRSRYYADPLHLTHVIGFVGAVSRKEKELSNDKLLSAPEFKIGKTGLEKKYDLTLRGEAGYKTVEVNAYRKIVRTISSTSSKPGKKINLTIDSILQKKIYNLFEPYHTGACAVMDAHTGELCAFVSYPGFDGNIFSHRIDKKSWQDLSQNPYRPLVNKLISGQYSPGSIFKMIIALAALEKGIVKHNTVYHCPGHFDLNGHKFHCWSWRTGGHGAVNLTQAIAISCDVYFYNLALKLGAQEIADIAKRFGLDSATGIELDNEKSGFIPTPEWQKRVFNRRWSKGDTINFSIGQGALLSTPLQLCRMTAALVNGGRLVTPHLLSDTVPEASIIDINPDHLKVIQKGMEDVVNKPYGTGHRARINKQGFEIGGKTGSTQVSRITKEQRRLGTHNDRPWHLKEHALFVGYGPIHDPKFVTTVLIEHGGSGGRFASPIGKEALLLAQELFS